MKEKVLRYFETIRLQLQNMAVELRLSSMTKPFLWLLGIYIVATFSIIRADFDFMDDLGRITYGYRGWENYSRWISVYGSIFLHDGRYITDISPFTQWLALGLMSLAGVIILKCFTRTNNIPWYGILCILPMTLSPYFLECFSFKFDSPYMALSVLGSVLPFLWWRGKIHNFLIMSFVGLFLMCNTYQASSGIYIVMALFMLLQDFIAGENKSDLLKKLGMVMGVFLLSMGIYKIMMVKEVGAAQMAPINRMYEQVILNIKTNFRLFKSDLPKRWLLYAYGIGCMTVISSFLNAKKRKLLCVIFTILVVIGGAILSFGIYILLRAHPWAPRTMYGIGVYISVMAAFLVGGGKNFYLDKILCLCLSWSCMIYSLTYGNALVQEKKYVDFRTSIICSDLDKILSKSHSKKKIEFIGDGGHSPVVTNIAKKYPVIKRVMRPYLHHTYLWSYYFLFHQSKIKNIQREIFKKNDLRKYNLPVILERNYHTIRADDKNVLIEVR